MRIIGGRHRGRTLLTPSGQKTRPTADRARQALFNILEHASWAGPQSLIDAQVIDIFAGTGALALEALSRGAAHAVMVDKDLEAVGLCKKNAAALKESGNTLIFRADGTRITSRPDALALRTLAFLDPPYAKGLGTKGLESLLTGNWLAPEAICVLEMSKQSPDPTPPNFEILDERVYGVALIRFLRYSA